MSSRSWVSSEKRPAAAAIAPSATRHTSTACEQGQTSRKPEHALLVLARESTPLRLRNHFRLPDLRNFEHPIHLLCLGRPLQQTAGVDCLIHVGRVGLRKADVDLARKQLQALGSSRGAPQQASHRGAPRQRAPPLPPLNMVLWAKPMPKRLRVHDLRHTTATLLLAAGVDLYAVARILRHTDPHVTFETYAAVGRGLRDRFSLLKCSAGGKFATGEDARGEQREKPARQCACFQAVAKVRLARFERAARGFEGRCSIQLSYRRIGRGYYHGGSRSARREEREDRRAVLDAPRALI